jgi:hydroxyacyl-ACP dehydratase HTD2-like protein with hotdog domain
MLLLLRHLPSLFADHSRSISTLSERLNSTLKSRSLPILYDYLNPQASHLLTTTLLSYLPFLSTTTSTRLPSTASPHPLPPAHHLVYFPTPTTPSSLLPDGTDTLHSPGEPFTHRLWAGGHIRFPAAGGPLLNGARAALVETIRHVRISGPPGSEKVFVGIERRVVAPVEDGKAAAAAAAEEKEDDPHIRARVCKEQNEADQDDSILSERRDLCFLRPESTNIRHPDTFDTAASLPPPPLLRPLKPPPNPQFIHHLIPDPVLLFRFSALTYNAHAIHLDPLYTRAVYRQPALLVHGPLLLTLMLTCLKHELEKSGSERARSLVREIRYRCLAPVYVGEGIRICGRKVGKKSTSGSGSGEVGQEREEQQQQQQQQQEWEVWVEKGGDAGAPPALTVRGTVRTTACG